MKKTIFLFSLFIGINLVFIAGCCEKKEATTQQEKPLASDHIIIDEFGAWKVKHVFDRDSLSYEYSNAKTAIILDNGEEFPFQIYRRSDHFISYIIPGWIEKVIFTVDGVNYEEEQEGHHTFYGEANDNLYEAIAMTKSEIKIEFFSGGEVFSGTINPEGAYAALKWIRVID